MIDGKPAVRISKEILKDTNPKWIECLVDYYVGNKLPFKMTKNVVKKCVGDTYG